MFSCLYKKAYPGVKGAFPGKGLFSSRECFLGARERLFGAKAHFGVPSSVSWLPEHFLIARECFLAVMELFLGARENFFGTR